MNKLSPVQKFPKAIVFFISECEMGPDLAGKLLAGESLSSLDKVRVADHVSWLVRETWKKYEQLEDQSKNTNHSKPLNDNSSLNIRYRSYESLKYHASFSVFNHSKPGWPNYVLFNSLGLKKSVHKVTILGVYRILNSKIFDTG